MRTSRISSTSIISSLASTCRTSFQLPIVRMSKPCHGATASPCAKSLKNLVPAVSPSFSHRATPGLDGPASPTMAVTRPSLCRSSPQRVHGLPPSAVQCTLIRSRRLTFRQAAFQTLGPSRRTSARPLLVTSATIGDSGSRSQGISILVEERFRMYQHKRTTIESF